MFDRFRAAVARLSRREAAGEPEYFAAEDLPAEFTELAEAYEQRRVGQFILDEEMRHRQVVRIARTIHTFFASTNSLRATVDRIASDIHEFERAYLASPVTRNQGGMNYSGALNLFLMARTLSPPVIIESGVWKGLSSYILSAACPKSRILAFDLNFRELMHRSAGVEYREQDWMEADISGLRVAGGLCFFDDHVNQALRLTQAHERGFRHLIVDDSWSIEAVNGCGCPPLPSIDMVVDNSMRVGQAVRWVEGRTLLRTYTHTKAMEELCQRARRLVKAAYEVPTLYRETGIEPSSALKFVELV